MNKIKNVYENIFRNIYKDVKTKIKINAEEISKISALLNFIFKTILVDLNFLIYFFLKCLWSLLLKKISKH